jgi:hypothetical protein
VVYPRRVPQAQHLPAGPTVRQRPRGLLLRPGAPQGNPCEPGQSSRWRRRSRSGMTSPDNDSADVAVGAPTRHRQPPGQPDAHDRPTGPERPAWRAVRPAPRTHRHCQSRSRNVLITAASPPAIHRQHPPRTRRDRLNLMQCPARKRDQGPSIARHGDPMMREAHHQVTPGVIVRP